MMLLKVVLVPVVKVILCFFDNFFHFGGIGEEVHPQ